MKLTFRRVGLGAMVLALLACDASHAEQTKSRNKLSGGID
jgi:hypothetical protein